jgi:hypothetical protein
VAVFFIDKPKHNLYNYSYKLKIKNHQNKNMTKPLTTLLQKEMSRKEFLATMGFGVASVMGLSTVIQLLTGKSLQSQLGQHTGQSLGGYGMSAYGGQKDGR